MNLTEKDLQSFVLAEWNTYNLNGLSINKKRALDEIRAEILEELEDLNSSETKEARLKHFKVTGATADDYAEEIYNLGDEKKILYGIRNMGGNSSLPFISLRANFKLRTRDEYLKIGNLLKDKLSLFNPLFIGFHTDRKSDVDFYGSIHMVSPINRIVEKSPWPMEKQLRFETISDNSYYDWYRNGYEEFHLGSPELKSKVTVNSQTTMESSLKAGLLQLVYLNDQRIGLIAAEKSSFLGMSGIYFLEIFIDKDWKGQGLAKAIQRKFIHDFCQNFEVVWGIIDSHNLPSYKTASSNLRRPLRYECFITL